LKNIKNKLVKLKEDKNFLEYPLWILDRRSSITKYSLEKDNGTYEISTSSNKLPDRIDKLILYYLMLVLFENNFEDEISVTRYRVVKNVFSCKGATFYYNRILKSLERWHGISVKFEGIFFNGENHTTRGFHIIDSYKFDHKTGEIMIRFNKNYVEQIKSSNYYKLIDFNEVKKLKRDISVRLYEILTKQSLPWHIGVKKLAEKLTLNKKYPSDILSKLYPAINEINKNTDLKVLFSSEKNKEGKTICIFEKMVESQLPTTADSDNKSSVSPIILKAIPREYQVNSVFKIIEPYHDKPDYVISNIKYTNGKYDKNYSAYLKLALQEDYAKVNREVKEKKDKVVQKKKDHILEKKNQEKLLKQKVWDYFNSLPEGERLKFRSDAEEKMSAALKFIKIPEGRKDIINAQIEKDMIMELKQGQKL